jgi:hypothetical protein
MIPWLWFVTAWGFAGAGSLLLIAEPELALVGYGHVLVPTFVHLLTLGVILSGHYGTQAARWRSSEGGPFWAALVWLVWGFHAGGAASLAWAMDWEPDRAADALARLGGHYLLPTAIALSVGGEVVHHFGARRRGSDSDGGGLERHLPGLGLLVAMSLGVMLILDRLSGRYGFYGLAEIALHALAAAFLFVLPAQALAEAGEPAQAGAVAPGTLDRQGTAPRALLAGLGLFAMALDERAFGAGFAGGMPLGLALLAAVALWSGLPAPQDWRRSRTRAARRLPWALFGLLLLDGALRAWRSVPAAEALPLAAMGGAWFLVGVAGPDWLLRLASLAAGSSGNAERGVARSLFAEARLHAALVAGALVVLAGQAAGWAPAVRAGTLLWLGGSLALGGRAAGSLMARRRDPGRRA